MSDLTTNIAPVVDFLRRAQALKETLRSTWTFTGRQESAAEHSWSLALFAMALLRRYPELDRERILKLCILHDLGEAIHGDIPAPDQALADKADAERTDLLDLLRPLPGPEREEFLALWEDYEGAGSPEARLVKALDKLETLVQQNHGHTPPDFDYAFNLDYGTRYTGLDGVIRELRAIVDEEIAACMLAREGGRVRDAESTGPHEVRLEGWISSAPFEELLGMDIREAAEGRAVLRMPFVHRLAQGAGLMHGGALVALADTAAAMAAKSILPEGTHFGTISLETRFLRPVRQGVVTAVASVERDGRTITAQALVEDEQGERVMELACVFKIARGQPDAGT
jgi:putative hydrolase of HD superfamily